MDEFLLEPPPPPPPPVASSDRYQHGHTQKKKKTNVYPAHTSYTYVCMYAHTPRPDTPRGFRLQLPGEAIHTCRRSYGTCLSICLSIYVSSLSPTQTKQTRGILHNTCAHIHTWFLDGAVSRYVICLTGGLACFFFSFSPSLFLSPSPSLSLSLALALMSPVSVSRSPGQGFAR